MRRRHVVQIIGRMNIGGPARLVMLAAHGLAARGDDTTLIVGRPEESEGDLTDAAEAEGLRVVRVPSMARRVFPPDDARAFASIYAHLRRLRPDVVHTHTAKAGTLGRLAARAARVPHVAHTFHGHVFEGYFSPLVSTAIVQTERALAHVCDRIVAVSEAARRDILHERICAPEKLVTIHPGVELQPFLAADGDGDALRRAWGVGADRAIVGLVARLVPVKQVDVFLRLAERVPHAAFVIAGDGPDRSHLEALRAASPARDRIHFAGFHTDLATLYRALDVVVLCSANEGLPVALIEAQAAARPVAAYDVGGVCEVVRDGDTGRVVAAGDEPALAAAVQSFVENAAERARCGARGRAFMQERYSAERMIDATDALYASMLATTSRRS